MFEIPVKKSRERYISLYRFKDRLDKRLLMDARGCLATLISCNETT